jgi:putative Ca2+/H+ antiporter (TMEM165/GDT1 family)
MDLKLFATTFGLIFVAELPDKTALATVMLATQGRGWAIFSGVALAFVVQTLVAVLFGSAIGLLPEGWVKLGAGVLFLVFAVLAWRRQHEDGCGHEHEHEHEHEREHEHEAQTARATQDEPTRSTFAKTALQSFIVIFLAEWGDLTQLATASLAARYPAPKTLFAASVLALWSVTGLAIFVGQKARGRFNPAVLNRVAAALFAAIGLYFLRQSWMAGLG